MKPRRRESTLFSPLVVGALTVLITIVAVILAFQANNGLPFVPRYTLHVRVTNAEELTRGNEVHMGGSLVGAVSSVSPARDGAGTPIAVIDVQLSKSVEPLPVDSRFTIRLKGAIGEKYLDITLGHARRTWPTARPCRCARPARPSTSTRCCRCSRLRRAPVSSRRPGFADALSGRGSDLNDALAAFVPLIRDLGPVMRNLASPGSDLRGFIDGLGSFAGALAPVAESQAELFVNLDTSFRALANVAVPYLQDLISRTPPAFQSVIDAGPQLQAFLTDTSALLRELRPGFATLPSTAPILADTFAAGARNLPGTAALDRQLVSLARTLQSYGENTDVQRGLDRLTLTARSLIAPLSSSRRRRHRATT